MTSQLAAALVLIANREEKLKVREIRDTNCGPRVDIYKAATWLPADKSWPWCAAFVCWCVREAMRETGVKETPTFRRPQTAGAWDFINWSREQDTTTKTIRSAVGGVEWDVQPGDIVVYNFSHIGICVEGNGGGNTFKAVEGNTDASGSREGGGVYLKTRNVTQIRALIRFTK